MKKVKLLFFVLISISVLNLVSCKKDDDGGTTPGSNGSISLVVDGSSWNASLSVQAVNTNGVINITGSDSNAKQASIMLYNVTETGTYTVEGSNQLRWTEGLGQDDSYIASFLLGSGTITVTELSATSIKGTFSFTGVNTAQSSKSITDGVFEATF